ncbi:MAG: CPBP family glutamic-type intramembrane protease [Promethearchaeota archaeon]|jgi:membrane protease YdiL (CAAX protease family)
MTIPEANENKITGKIYNSILYNLVILLVFLFWFSYSMYDNLVALLVINVLIFLSGGAIVVLNDIKQLKPKVLPFQFLILAIPILFCINIFFFYRPYAPPFFFGISRFIGLWIKFDLIVFIVIISIVFLKLIGIYLYFMKNRTLLEKGQGDATFQFFAENINLKKVSLLLLLFPLSAFVEELIYRSLLLSFFMLYFNLNVVLGVLIISLLFGVVHFSTSGNWGHVVSTFLSSIIYFIALIFLGLIYSWMFHLLTNVTVIFFYNFIKKRNIKLPK